MGNGSIKLLALDIDGVLNCYSDMQYWISSYNGETPPEIRVYDHGNFVSEEKLARLHRIIKETGVTVIGVSSWFCCRDDDEIAEFLGITENFIGSTSSTGGGMARVRSLTEFVRENNIDFDAVFVLDDQTEGYTEYGYKSFHPVAFGLTEEMTQNIINAIQEYDNGTERKQ